MTNDEGAAMTVGGLKPHLSLPAGSYAIDNNGNLTNRQSQSLTWTHENRLESYYRAAPYLYETYLYDAAPSGLPSRVRKTSNGVNTFYPNQFYETSSSLTIKYYYFNGQRIAQRNNGTLYYLHNDHLGGMALSTSNAGNATLGYWAYGRPRTYSGSIPTRRQFTGQYIDDSGLYYFNARYYDPELGQFLSPDTIVPDATNLFDYNRYMYVRGNPMHMIDPTGHAGIVANCRCGGGWNEQIDGPRLSESKHVRQVGMHLAANIVESLPYADTPNDVLVATTGCGYACQAGYEEPVGGGWRGVAVVSIVLPFGVRFIQSGVDIAKTAFKLKPAIAKGVEYTGMAARGSNVFEAYSSARSMARELAGLGDDTVDFVQEIGPFKGQVTGRMSSDGLKGWRIDYDEAKGFHVNWWDRTGGNKRSDWQYGSITIEGGTYDNYLETLAHYPKK